MKAVTLCAMMMSAAIIVTTDAGASPGRASRAPEQLGAHWARVSDEAAVQLIVDQLRSIGGGTGPQDGGPQAVVMRKHASAFVRTNISDAPSRVPSGAKSKDGQTASRNIPATSSPSYVVRMQNGAASVEFTSGERLFMEKRDGVWGVTGGSLPKDFYQRSTQSGPMLSITGGAGVSVGESFTAQPVSSEHRIGRLTKGVTRSQLGRDLFGLPGKTASYHSILYRPGLPVPVATYIQFVLDEQWNRIVYGNLNSWLKTYAVQTPSAIAVDTDGNLFVGEAARRRVLVLKLVGTGDATLQFHHTIDSIAHPTDIAVSDNGTPFTTGDDFLYIADATQNKIFKYTAGGNANSLVATFHGFDAPNAVAAGRWNGANNRVLYVIDKIAKRVRAFVDEGSSLSLIAQYQGDYAQYFTSVKTDHFGNVYLADNVASKIVKLTPELEFLDEHGSDMFTALGSMDIPFARVDINGDRRWVGFDQLFAIERWDHTSGVQRRRLGVSLKNIAFFADDNVSGVRNTFTLTDVAKVTARIYDEKNRLVRTLSSSWLIAGMKNLHWDRRSGEGVQVPAGMYRYELEASSAYADESRGGEPTISNTRFYLPLYYAEDCGSANRADDAHLIRGSAARWGDAPWQTASEDESSVQYRFSGLNPAGEYEVAAEFAANDNLQRLQELTAGGRRLAEPVRVATKPIQIGFVRIPKEAYASGDLTIAVNRVGEGSVLVTQLWLKEVGKGFHPEPLQTLPTKYVLEQNYPNPFNPVTTIRYTIPEDGLVTLKVYTIAGQEVATIVNEPQRAGKHEVTFNAATSAGGSLASGVYLYRVKAGNFSEVKKMVLLR